LNVLDASALLAFLQDGQGSDVVQAAPEQRSVCGAANWSEVAQKLISHGRDWDLAKALLLSFGPRLEAVSMADAENAARRWKKGSGLSLADRLCLALGDRLGVEARSADSAWEGPGVRQIR